MCRKLLTAKIAEKGRDEHKKSRQRVGFATFSGFLLPPLPSSAFHLKAYYGATS
jgi:hypothetical protein